MNAELLFDLCRAADRRRDTAAPARQRTHKGRQGDKKLGAELLGARSRIISEEGREPQVSELAEAVGVTPEEAAAAIEAIQAPASLSWAVGDDDSGLELGDRISDSDGLAELESVRDRIAISQAIGRLPPLWRQIVMFRYFRNMTQQRTAEELGLTQVKVRARKKR